MATTKQPKTQPTQPKAGGLARFIPIAVLALIAGGVFVSGAYRHLSFDALRENHALLETFVENNFLSALALYMAAYIAVAALSLPGATVMSVLGGFLFGLIAGTAAVVVSATIGGTVIFVAARTAFADFFRTRASGFIKKLETGFNENAFSYLLLLRLIPLLPFFVVNVVPAFTKIRTVSFVTATFIGIIPGAFAFVSAGNGLGAVLARGGDVNLSGLLLQPEVITPIVALSILAVLPILYQKISRSKQSPSQQ